MRSAEIAGVPGLVEHLHVARVAGAPMEPRAAVDAVAGRGLIGDRYGTGVGSYSAATPGPERHLTLITAEALEDLAAVHGIHLAPGSSRRNVTTRGIDLAALVGQDLSVGDVRVRVVELCEPCGYLQRLLDVPRLVQMLDGRAGVNVEVVSGGTIRVGDAVDVTSSPVPSVLR